jgi:carboxymethylenebutenolidase
MAEKIRAMLQEYREGRISRREFIHKAVALTGSLAAATTFADALFASAAHGAQVDPNDSGLKSGDVQYPGTGGTVFGYLSRPAAAGKYPAIVIISDNQGLVDHFRDVARRYAKEGYIALVPDVFSRHGGTAKVNPKGTGVRNYAELAPDEAVSEFVDAGYSYLKSLPEVRSDRLGITGFCWGGGQAYLNTTQVRGLRAAVIFYGETPQPVERLERIEAPVFVHYAESDERITGRVPQTEAAMKKYNKSYEYKIYPGTQHAFFHDQRPDRYQPEAAKEAWGRTVEFFKKHLQG